MSDYLFCFNVFMRVFHFLYALLCHLKIKTQDIAIATV